VDDELRVGTAIQRGLCDCDVAVTVSGAEALAWISAGQRFDTIFCDLMMPEMSGVELHAEIERLAPEQAARMVFITGGATTVGAQAFLDAMPNPVIDKPFELQRLREAVRSRLGP
jgi:CheY-like chemotaxis protein